LPSGSISVRATGADGIMLAAGSALDVAGVDVEFSELSRGSDGGRIQLVAEQGAIRTSAGSALDVSGAGGSSNAGFIEIDAAGAVDLDPAMQLRAAAEGTAQSGSLDVQAQSLTRGFASLNSLANAGGVGERLAVQQRTGDIVIGAGQTVQARVVELAADSGNIDVTGTVRAGSTHAGGTIDLAAGGNLNLRAGAMLDASASVAGAGGEGGHIRLATTAGQLGLAVGSVLDAGDASSGSINLRAPRVGTDGVAIMPIDSTIRGTERVDIEAFRTYSGAVLDAAVYAGMAVDSAAYMANAAAIKSSLGVEADARFHLHAGEELRSNGNLLVAGPLNLLGYRPGGETGVLTLRAAGDLTIAGSISDGVQLASSYPELLPARDTVQVGESWSYRLVAGADPSSAGLLSTVAGRGDVTVASGAMVRTGTGDIEVAAGRDVRLADTTAAIYTVGVNRGTGNVPIGDLTEATPVIIKDALLGGDFLGGGGDIRVVAGRDVIGADGNQFITNWLARVAGPQSGAFSSITMPSAWAVNVEEFRQNIGALGGGDVSIRARRDVRDLGVMLPTTGLPTALGSAPEIAGGGNLSIDAGGDLRGGMLYVERGDADLRIGGAVAAGSSGRALPVVALGDARLDLSARQSVGLESILNAMALSQTMAQGFQDLVSPSTNYFFSYGSQSSARISSTSGNVLLRGSDPVLAGIASDRLDQNATLAYGVLPGSLYATAFQGDVQFGSSFTLYPSATGQLELVAAGNIGLSPVGVRQVDITLSDADPALLPDAANPVGSLQESRDRLGQPRVQGIGNADTPVHSGDAQPVRIVARDGILGIDPNATGATGADQLSVYLAKPAQIRANHISNLNLTIQNIDPDDVSVIASDTSIDFPTQRGTDAAVRLNSNAITVDGPGRLDLVAGTDINLGASEGVVSRGRRFNDALPAGGASLSLQAGVSPDLDDSVFIDAYLTTETYASRLHSYLTRLGMDTGGAGSDAERFSALPAELRRPFVLAVYFNELLAAGLAATTGDTTQFERGSKAAEALFGTTEGRGNVNMFLSRIVTQDGGDVSIAAPWGLVNAGIANTSIVRDAGKLSRLGILIQGDGTMNAYTGKSFLVNQTRIFVLDGGDILIWSEKGDIDAGGGAKTALNVQKPEIVYNFDAVPASVLPPAIAGSGIRTAVTTPGKPPGSVYLFAPSGIVNAGDAGIQSVGNITIVAVQVIGADNISAGGSAVGVPVDSGGAGVAVAGASAAASSASAAASDDTNGTQDEEPEPVSEAALSWLEVFVTGMGEENCKPDDAECLKREREKQ
jgi:filamentous hemagglutinin